MTAKIALITGASSGIGANVAIRLKAEGYYVIALARSLPASEAYDRLINCDLSDITCIQSACSLIIEDYKKIDLFLHCAGLMLSMKASSIDIVKLNNMFLVNSLSPIFIVSRLTRLLARANGKVIFVSSISSELDIPGELCYSASKDVLRKVAKGFSSELSRLGIGFFTLLPALIDTPMTADLSDEQKNLLRSKQSVNEHLSSEKLSELILNMLRLPNSATSSELFYGGVKRW